MSLLIRAGLVGLALLAALVPLPPAWVERFYSQHVYLVLQRFVTPLTNATAFAWFDLLVLVGALAVVLSSAVVFRRRRRQGTAGALGRTAVHLAAIASVLYLGFLLMWGLNYRREPLTARLKHEPSRVSSQEVMRVWREMATRANVLHPRVHQEGFPGWDGVPALLRPSFVDVQKQLADVSPAVPGRAKWSLLDGFFRRAGVDGMTDPFLLEVLVNQGLLPFERPAVLAHEWAHLAGYASEAEAGFVSWLVCLQGPPQAEYSGRLAVLWQLAGVLPDAERPGLMALLDAGPRGDLRAIAARVAGTTPVVREVSWRVYDRYLKANRIDEGVENYGLALRLLLGTEFDRRYRPARRPVATE